MNTHPTDPRVVRKRPEHAAPPLVKCGKEVDAVMTRIMVVAYTWILALLMAPPKRDERGEAVPWLIVIGAGIGIAYFAGDSVLAFAKGLVGKLG